MLSEKVDLKLTNDDGYYDISIDEDGDLGTTRGLNTSLTVSFLTDRRATESEVSNPRYRRGWWGNDYQTDSSYPEMGSKIWLLNQTTLTQDTVNDATAYTQAAYQWLLDDSYADEVQVMTTSNFDTININIRIIKNDDVIGEQVYSLWQNTVREILNG